MLDKNNYTIKHNWGDPREPEYHNGNQVFFILYRDDQRFLRFRVLSSKNTHREIEWTIAPPSCIRKSFKSSNKYLDVCNLVLNYLKTSDFSKDYRLKDADFSDIPGLFSTQLAVFKEKYSRQLMLCPKFPQLLIFLAGIIIVLLHQYNSVSIGYSPYIKPLLFTLGCTTILMLVPQIKKDYRATCKTMESQTTEIGS